MDIVFSSDDGFVEQLIVASSSAVYASMDGKNEVVIHVLDCGISEPKWNEYKHCILDVAGENGVKTEIVRHIIDMRQFENVSAWTNGSKAAWARILLPQILQSVSCCVYSDCDVFFVSDPSKIIEELLASGKTIIGHKNPFGDRSPDARWFKANNLPYLADEYFCSGLVAMNLDLMRAEDIVNSCWKFLQEFPSPISVDQTVLNHVCSSNKGILSDGWGLFTHECYADGMEIKAIHFSGGWPWKCAKNVYDALCIRLSGQANEIWHLFQTSYLGRNECRKPKVSFLLRAEAAVLLWFCRFMLRAGIVPARLYCLLELVRAYEGPASGLKNIKSFMFCRKR